MTAQSPHFGESPNGVLAVPEKTLKEFITRKKQSRHTRMPKAAVKRSRQWSRKSLGLAQHDSNVAGVRY